MDFLIVAKAPLLSDHSPTAGDADQNDRPLGTSTASRDALRYRYDGVPSITKAVKYQLI
jgi:hypothetical protein